MTSVLTALAVGALIGAQHAFEPDHLAAVGTMIPGETSLKHAATRGAWWGLGHGVAIATLGLPLILLGMNVPEPLEGFAEVIVALMLIGLGAHALFRARNPQAPQSTHSHARRTLPVGLIHGLAGSGAAVVLATTQAPTPSAALSFLLVFVIGSMLSMTALAALASWPLGRLIERPSGMKWLLSISGVISIAVGILWGMPRVISWLS